MTDRENITESIIRAVRNGATNDELRQIINGLLKEHEKPDCEHAEHDSTGCLGYAGCTQDDEPIDVCKTCREYTGNRYEEVSGDG